MPESHGLGADASPLTLIPLVSVAALMLVYLMAARHQRQVGNGWSGWRCVFFAGGSLLLAAALAPPALAWAHHDLRGHMAQHLVIGMLAPLAWVLAAPVTLLLKTLPAAAARRLVALLQSRPLRGASHPVAALLLNVGGMYLLYLTPLYAATQQWPVLHAWMHLHFLLAGYLFCWTILAGPDSAPQAHSLHLRLWVLFVSMAAHAILGKIMYGYLWPRNTGHDVEEIQAAAMWMYYGGDLAEALLAIALMTMWWRMPRRRREALPRLF